MSPKQAYDAIRDRRRARVRAAFSDEVVMAEGRVIAYSIVPMVLLEGDDGERSWWRHDHAELTGEDRP